MRQHTGELPTIGVNTFYIPHGHAVQGKLELARSADGKKQGQLKRLAEFHARHASDSPATLPRLQPAVMEDLNVFDAVMGAVRVCSPGQITAARFEVSAQFWRNMWGDSKVEKKRLEGAFFCPGLPPEFMAAQPPLDGRLPGFFLLRVCEPRSRLIF